MVQSGCADRKSNQNKKIKQKSKENASNGGNAFSMPNKAMVTKKDDDLQYVEVTEEEALCDDEAVSDDDELDADDFKLLRIDEREE